MTGTVMPTKPGNVSERWLDVQSAHSVAGVRLQGRKSLSSVKDSAEDVIDVPALKHWAISRTEHSRSRKLDGVK